MFLIGFISASRISLVYLFVFFFSSRRRHTRFDCDWSSDVCSSDLLFPFHGWLPDAYRESPPEVASVLSGVVSKAAIYGFIRIGIAKFPEPVKDFRRSEEHTSELQSQSNLVCRLLLEKKNTTN